MWLQWFLNVVQEHLVYKWCSWDVWKGEEYNGH